MSRKESEAASAAVHRKSLRRTVIARFSMLFPILGLMFFLPAWSLRYWEGWVYMLVLAVPMGIFMVYLFRHNPKLLERRMKTAEKRKRQRLVVMLSFIFFPLIFCLPGLDHRLGWSRVPLAVKIIAFALVLAGYLMTVYVLRVNSYASRVVEVEEDHRLISTGPYRLVRHPMYSSMIPLYLCTPLALGSYWAVIPAALFLLVLVPRILDEEKELLEHLPGYREYTRQVRYRLIPAVW